ncbi:MAG: ATP-binding protein [Polyangia bacterium]
MHPDQPEHSIEVVTEAAPPSSEAADGPAPAAAEPAEPGAAAAASASSAAADPVDPAPRTRRAPSAESPLPDAEDADAEDADADAETGRDEAADPEGEEPDNPLLLAPEPSASMSTRRRFLVPAEVLTVSLDPQELPEQPRPEASIFDLVTRVARRALDLGFGLASGVPLGAGAGLSGSRDTGFHVFIAADPDVMIEEEVVRYAGRFASAMATPPDLAYVHDFDHPEAPRPLLLPPGAGPALVEAMDELIDGLRERIPQLAEAEEIERAHAKLASELEARNKQIMQDLESTARTHGFGVRTVQGAVQTFPILHGKPLSAEQYDVLDEPTKRALQTAADRLTREVEKAARLVRAHSAKFEADQSAAMARAAGSLIQREMRQLFERFAPLSPEVARFLRRVRQALTDDWEDFFEPPEPVRNGDGEPSGGEDEDPELATRLLRFRVNLLTTHRPGDPAPVIYDTNPTYANLFGYLERRARFGALLTDFTRIRPGSLHRAMGGVLVLRASDLLADPQIWERMKRVLRERRMAPEDPTGPLGLYATTLRPAPVPVALRLVLVGTPELYAALRDADADFASLFRIKVEVDPVVARTPAYLVGLDAVLMNLARERGLYEFDRGARARLLDLATRLAEDRERLALWLSPLEETATFASAAAAARTTSPGGSPGRNDDAPASTGSDKPASGKAPIITAADIDEAWRERRERLASDERHIREMTLRGEVALDTEGFRTGVVNGLSVFHTGDVEFGQPMRITAVVSLGREGIVDVEREAQLGGAIHTKGVAILRGYLARMFGQERPLSLRAQLVFEQSYGEIDGDSASSSELFAVLSALADVGVDQSIAVTGSVNQLGELQAIGGVCAKIEGFFDLCAARGLTGSQGVLIPKANLPHLVLRPDVAAAVREGRFSIYSIETVAEGIEVLTGLGAGERDQKGRFPAASVFGRVERRIIEIAERLRQAESHGYEASDGLEDGGGDLSDGDDFRALGRTLDRPAGEPRSLQPPQKLQKTRKLPMTTLRTLKATVAAATKRPVSVTALGPGARKPPPPPSGRRRN